jgi:hypothetical protein
MPFVLRDTSGKITKVSVRALAGGETLPHHHPDVMEFLKTHQQEPKDVEDALAELRSSDGEMSRAIEDLIMVLLKKNIIRMSDMPRPVQDRMATRVKLRARIEDVYERASATRTGGSGSVSDTAQIPPAVAIPTVTVSTTLPPVTY